MIQIESYTETEITEIKQLSGHEISDWSGLRVKKINRTARAIVGTLLVLTNEIDTDVKVEVQLFKKQGGEYRKLPYNFPQSEFCASVNRDNYWYPELVKYSDLPMPFPCPVPIVNILKLKLYS